MMVSDPVLPQRLPNRLLPAMCGARFARRLACFGAVATFACAGLMPAHAQDSNSSSFSSERNVRNDAREGDDDAGTGCTNRVTQCTGTTMDVDDLVRQIEFAHRGHGDGSERFIDFPQVDIGYLPAGTSQSLVDRTGRPRAEPVQRMRET